VRGFADKLSEEEASTGNYTCSRCNKVIKWGDDKAEDGAIADPGYGSGISEGKVWIKVCKLKF
jgi:hypothetical protein